MAMVGMRCILFLFMVAKVQAVSRTPPNPATVTMYNLRPYNDTADITNKNSADALGDIFFYITDRLVTPYACRHAPKGHPPFTCRDFQKILQTHDQVYTELRVQVDSSYGGCPSGSWNCSQYGDCNPRILSNKSIVWDCDCDSQDPQIALPSSHRPISRKLKTDDFTQCREAVDASGCNKFGTPRDACIHCAQNDRKVLAEKCESDYVWWLCSSPPKWCSNTGKMTVESRYCPSINSTGMCSTCADSCDGPWHHWKSELSRLGGLWYSTAKEGNCSNPASKCSWKVLREVKTVNATCANNNVHAVVEKKGRKCFSQCSQPTNTTSDCWILCFIETVLGRDPLNLTNIVGTAMTASELKTPWLKAFESDDPSKGGCAALPPATQALLPTTEESLLV